MADLFDDDMTTDEALAVLKATTMPADAVMALAVVIDQRGQLMAVADMAAAVRVAQKRYFKDRTTEALHASKELEGKLDALLRTL